MKQSKLKTIIIILIILLIFCVVYFILNNLKNNETIQEFEYLKDYGVNEYIVTYISDEAMARIYLNDYMYNMYSDVNKAYELLDDEYKNKKFGSLENYVSYVNSLPLSNYKLEKYYKINKDGYIIFGVYDNQGLFYAFKTNGVLQYSVYLDDYTVEI